MNEPTARRDGRADDALRPTEIEPNFLKNAPGSVLIRVGDTRVVCAASIEDRVPPHLVGKGEGWVTGEYSMLPAAANRRMQREVTRGRPSGRTMEIQRLIGRALRAVVDRKALGERTLWLDCDVIEADGGTRTASITGGFVAMCLALHRLRTDGLIRKPVLVGRIAAVSVGVVAGRALLDLDYPEDSSAEIDMNVVGTDEGGYVEIQGTAETEPFPRAVLDQLLARADHGLALLHARQAEVLGPILAPLLVPKEPGI